MSTSDEARAEYTPTASDVMFLWTHEYRDRFGGSYEGAEAAWDRWLAAHDAEVLAAAQRPLLDDATQNLMDERDELRAIVAEVEIHRESDVTGKCVCGADWICEAWASQKPTWIDRATTALEAAQRPPVSPEARDEMIDVASHYNGPKRVVVKAVDAILARFSIPTPPEYDVEKVARWLAELEPGEDWPSNEALGVGLTGTRDDEYRDSKRDEAAALVAALPKLVKR